MSEYRNIGRLVSASGLQGELVLQHHFGGKWKPTQLKIVFLEEKRGEFLPYFLASVKKKNEDDVVLKLEGIDTREAAQRLLRKSVWLPAEEFARQVPAGHAPITWLGYRIVDGDRDLGSVLEIFEQPHQVLCRLEVEGREVLVPLHEESLRKADHRAKKLYVALPEGLLDVYLSKDR